MPGNDAEGVPTSWVRVPLDTGARTRTDYRDHHIVRRALLKELVNDEPVRQLYRAWEERTGLALDYAQAMQAHALTVEIWGGHEAYWRRLAGEGGDYLKAMQDEAEEISRALMNDPANEGLRIDAIRFAVTIGLPWAWVAAELVCDFVIRCFGAWRSGDVLASPALRDGPPPPIAPGVEMHFVAPQDGAETAGAALHRFNEMVAQVRAQLTAAVALQDPAPEVRESLERRAVWYYRVKVKEEPVSRVAREAFPSDTGDRRKDIRDGIARVEQLLNLSTEKLPAP